MRPVAIFRHAPTEGPGYFAILLEQHGIPWQLTAIDEGDAVPVSAAEYSGLCFMGGPMSVNDALPWIEPVCALIRDAVARNIPVIGHCLGGQLMSKALGGTIHRNPLKEIGWSQVSPQSNDTAQRWLGDQAEATATVFQWHGETFSLPPGASLVLANASCPHQAFALGPHLAMQCHIEMTPEMIATWSMQWPEEVANTSDHSAIQTPATMLQETPARLPAMRQLADQLYGVWIKNLKA